MSDELKSKLKAAREKLGLSQSEFAARIGVPLPTLRKWEQDQRTPRGLALTLLTEKLDAILSGK